VKCPRNTVCPPTIYVQQDPDLLSDIAEDYYNDFPVKRNVDKVRSTVIVFVYDMHVCTVHATEKRFLGYDR
jgi:hypothetical protein